MDTPEQYFYIALVLISLFGFLLCCCCKHRNDERSAPKYLALGSFRTLDLHGYTVKDAKEETNRFLAIHRYEKVRIITGQGNHNPNGLAPIKSEVIKILRSRGLHFYYENQGCLVVDA